MKTAEVHVGATYAAKISDKVVPVRIVQEKWKGDKLTGWTGVNTRTNRPVQIKSAAKLRHQVTDDHSEQSGPGDPPVPATPCAPGAPGDAPAEKPAKGKGGQKAPASPAEAKPRKISGLDAAAKVLKDAGKPMNFKDITEAVLAAGWTTSGKTPAATLYAAAIREIAAKGKDARFRKVERGLFEHTGVEAE